MLFVLVGSLGGLALGCALLLRTAAAIGFINSMNRWISTRRATRELEVPREGLRPSRLLGLFLVGGGGRAGSFPVLRGQVPPRPPSPRQPRILTPPGVGI